MKALRFENNQLNLREIERPHAADESLIRVVKSGICNTDIEIVKGYAGFSGTLGHEFVGVVEASDDANLIGKRVVGEINAGCGSCGNCRRGDARHCPARTVLGIIGRDGAHAEFVNLPTRNLFAVPDKVSDTQAVFVEPLAAAFGITEQIEIFPSTKIAVIGDGKLGNLCAQSLALKSDNLVLIGKHQAKLDLVRGKNIETIKLENAAKLNRIFDVVVEASGAETGFATALDLLKPRGKLVLKSTFSGKTALEMWRVVVDEITITGSRCGRFAPALELLENKSVTVENLVSAEFSLSDGIEAMREADSKGVMKIVLVM